MTEIELRAENYPPIALTEFVSRRGRFEQPDPSKAKRGPDIEYERDIINTFLKSDRGILVLYGPRGCGKTMEARLSIMENGLVETYMPYYLLRKVPEFCPRNITGEVVIVDDIHYMLDDIYDGKLEPESLTELIHEALHFASSGGKVILISEDIFTQDYLHTEEWEKLFPQFIHLNIPVNISSICKCHDIKDSNTIRMLCHLRPTARGVAAFLREYGQDWNTISSIALDRASTGKYLDKAAKNLIIDDYNYNKYPGEHPDPDIHKRWEKHVENYNYREIPKRIWQAMSPGSRKRFYGPEIAERTRLQQNPVERLRRDLCNANVDSREVLEVTKAVFEDSLYMDQSYFRHLMHYE